MLIEKPLIALNTLRIKLAHYNVNANIVVPHTIDFKMLILVFKTGLMILRKNSKHA